VIGTDCMGKLERTVQEVTIRIGKATPVNNVIIIKTKVVLPQS
jgi:hypothetical protein